ncbi:MAG: S9 family peptidase [Acidobacteria bacterium]|nr:S9 family peptidase [Acidobacteriota bacterium]
MSLKRGSVVSLRIALILFAISPSLFAQAEPGQGGTDQHPADQPPVARVIPHQETRFGTKVVDDYYWVREKSNPEVIKYLQQENAYTAAMTRDLGPFEDALYKEMLSHVKQTDLDVPVRRGDYLYYSRTEEGKQYPVHCRKKGSMEGREEILLDLNELGQGKKFVGLGAFEVSDDQNLLAYTLDYTGYRQFTLRVKDLRTGKTLPDTVERVDSVAWAGDNRTLFLTTEDAVTKRGNRAWRHTLGRKDSDPIYEEKDDAFSLGIAKTRDKRYLLLGAFSTDTSDVRYLRADRPQGTFTLFLPREKGQRYDIDHRENFFYVRSNKGAVNFQVFTTPENDPSPKNWSVFIAHDQDVLVENIELFRDFAVAVEKSQALSRLRVFDFQSRKWSTIAFPEPLYSVFPGETPEFTSPTYRYQYQSLVTPPSVFDYDTNTGKSILRKQQEVPGGYDASQYLSEREWVTVRDGVRVPLSIVYKKGFKRDGAQPLLLYGYGAYGIAMPATFSASRLVLLDRGVAFVIAHVRGGTDLGEEWHDNGKLLRKKNSFNDFIDCAEYLIREKWTSKEHLLIEGGSAGGLLMGAVVTMRPDLFRAVHLAVPFVDVMNDMFDPSLPLTTTDYPEWGNPTSDKAVYDYILSYSPYDNLRPAAYPAMLLTESLNDSQVAYWEAPKFVAKARTLNTDKSPILLKMKMDPASHGGASGRYDQLRDRAFEYAWLLSQAGITK